MHHLGESNEVQSIRLTLVTVSMETGTYIGTRLREDGHIRM